MYSLTKDYLYATQRIEMKWRLVIMFLLAASRCQSEVVTVTDGTVSHVLCAVEVVVLVAGNARTVAQGTGVCSVTVSRARR